MKLARQFTVRLTESPWWQRWQRLEPDNLAPCPTPGADCHVSSMPKAPVVNTTDALGLVF